MKLRAQLTLEMKKQPWWLYVLWLIIIVGFLGTIFIKTEITHHVGVEYKDKIGNQRTFWNKGTTTSAHQYLIYDSKQSIQNAKSLAKAAGDTSHDAGVKQSKAMLSSLQRHDYRRYNQLTLVALKTTGTANLPNATTMLSSSAADRVAQITQRVQFLVDHRLDRLLQIDTYAKVTGNIATALGFDNGLIGTPLIDWFLLIVIVITFATIFARDRRVQTERLMRAAPLNNPVIAITRSLITIALLNITLLLAYAIIILIMAAIPGREFGTWQFPIATSLLGHPGILPLSQALALYLLLFNLWCVLISGLAFALKKVLDNSLGSALILLLITFATPLHLTGLLPDAWQRFTPGFFTALRTIINNTGTFSSFPRPNALLTLASLGVAAWVIGSAVRYRK